MTSFDEVLLKRNRSSGYVNLMPWATNATIECGNSSTYFILHTTYCIPSIYSKWRFLSEDFPLYINPTISPRFTRAFPPIPSLLGTAPIRSVVSLTTVPWLRSRRGEVWFDKRVTSLWSLWRCRQLHFFGQIQQRHPKWTAPNTGIFGSPKYTGCILIHISEKKSVGISEYLTKRLLGSENFMICESTPPFFVQRKPCKLQHSKRLPARWDQYLGGQSQLHSYQRSLDDQQQGLWWCSTGGTPNANNDVSLLAGNFFGVFQKGVEKQRNLGA